MPHYCFFHQFPVELLHTLFTYFLAHEILLTFSNASDYVDNVILSYAAYRLNFQSIRKVDFDLVCRRIRPKQVLSLTLSDDDDTPGQSEAFFSRFQIEQFTQLQSLTLIRIEFDSLKSIFRFVYRLVHLRSLSFDLSTIRYKYSKSNESVPLNFLSLDNHTRLLYRLNRLYLNSLIDFPLIPFSSVRHLKLNQCSLGELQTIFCYAPQLKSLSVCLDIHLSKFEFNIPSNQLTQLKLEIKEHRISRHETEQFLSKLPHLKHLELTANVLNDIVDGYQWQILATSLITFNFKFNISHAYIDKNLDSFRTPFWLEEKRWYVVYNNRCLFSVPHFAPDYTDISDGQLHIHSTAPDRKIVYDRINKILVTRYLIYGYSYYYFTSVNTLVLKYDVSFDILASMIALNQIKHLSVLFINDLLKFMPLESTMPQLRELSIENSVTIDMIGRIRRYHFEQIHKLEISITGGHSDYLIEELFRLFPNIQYFIYKSPIHSEQTMIRFIDGFRNLANASFSVNSLSFYMGPNSVIGFSRRLTRDNFKCRAYHSPNNNSSFDIHWWIGEQSLTHCPSKRRYYWYRLRYLVYSNLPYIKYLLSFLVEFLICSSLAIIMHCFYFIIPPFYRFFCFVRKYNAYEIFVFILFLMLAFTSTILVLPTIIKLF